MENKKRNLLLTLRYDGSDFHGWQYQPNCRTVQLETEKAIKRILGEDVRLQSCSRTDAGVHANMFCCNFQTDCMRETDKILLGLNAVLPEDIAVYGVEEREIGFHARYDCKGKEYIYKIWNGRQRNPFFNHYAFHFPRKIDVPELNEKAKQFIGTHDFSSFCASGCTVKSTVRTVYDCQVIRDGETVIFSVKGNGFLYNMVRIMVGTMLDISDGKITAPITGIIEAKDRNAAGITAPACGLYLNKVFYESEGETR